MIFFDWRIEVNHLTVSGLNPVGVSRKSTVWLMHLKSNHFNNILLNLMKMLKIVSFDWYV